MKITKSRTSNDGYVNIQDGEMNFDNVKNKVWFILYQERYK